MSDRTQWTGKAVWILFWLSLASLVALGVSMNRSPLQWTDETMFGSGALGVARGSDFSTFNAFPEQSAPISWFYGPTFFEIGGSVMRVFGESMTVYRAFSFATAILFTLSVAFYAWVLSRSRLIIALSIATCIFAPEFGSGVTNGRMDNLGVALLLGGAACFLWALNEPRWASSIAVTVAGAGLFGLAMLTTPRCFPLAAGLGFSTALVAATHRSVRIRLLIQMAIFGSCVFLLIAAWTYSQGFGPLGWLQIIQHTSQGDEWNATPVLGGSWILLPGVAGLASFAAIAVAIAATVVARARMKALRLNAAEAIAAGMVVVSSMLTVLLTARPFSYLQFWGTPLLVTAVILSHPYWQRLSAGGERSEPTDSVRNSEPTAIAWMFLLIVVGGGALRAAKHLDIAASWRARDPGPLSAFIRQHVPTGSHVFGPYGFFFWAVETNGSSYVSANGWNVVDRRKLPASIDPTRVIGPPLPPIPAKGAFLVWPDRSPKPYTFLCDTMTEIAHFTPPNPRSPRAWDRLLGRPAGYPPATLYRVEACRRSS